MIKPSKYQEKIYDFITNGVGNAVINAKAGSGKTTTAVNALELIDKKKKVLYVAFNTSVADELKERIGGQDNIHICTFHSLGFSILRENYDNVNVEQYKYNSYVSSNLNKLSKEYSEITSVSKRKSFEKNILELVNFSRYNLAQSEREIKRIAEKYDIPISGDECKTVKKILDWGSKNTKDIDYTDMIWMPYTNNLSTKKYRYNWIFIDEAQDSSIAEQELIKKCYKRGCRFVAIGDEFQCINAFAGSNPEAFKTYLKEPNTKELKLSISYRCPKKIVEFAQKYVPDIEYAENAIEGNVNYNVSPFAPKSGDMVLCRNTAPLVKLYMDYLKVNKKAYIKGNSVGNELLSLVNSSYKEDLCLDLRYDGLFPRLYEKMFIDVENIVKNDRISEDEAFMSEQIMRQYDNIKSLETIAEGLKTREELKEKIKIIFLDSDGEGVCFSTVHKSKGLEADNIYILCKSLMPSQYAKKEWEISEEENLIYVAITRAKKTLSFIDEKEFSARIMDGKDSIIRELKNIRETVYSVFGKDPKYAEKLMEKNKKISDEVRKIKEVREIGKTSKQVNKKKIAGNKFSKFIK